MLEQFLRDIGLSDKEAEVYIALLQVDYASPLELSRKIDIKRATAYVVLKSLENKGLVKEVKINKKSRFEAAPPERLETFIGHQQVSLQEKAKLLSEMIPQFRSMQKGSGTKPIVKFLEGREGIMKSYEDSLAVKKEGETKYGVFSRDLGKEFFTDKERKYLKGKRIGSGVPVRSVYTYSGEDLSPDSLTEFVRIDEKKYPIFCDVDIYGDEVRINSLKNHLFSLYIRSKDIAGTLKSLVNYIIDSGKK